MCSCFKPELNGGPDEMVRAYKNEFAMAKAIARSVTAEFNELVGIDDGTDCEFVAALRKSGFSDLEIGRICCALTDHFEW